MTPKLKLNLILIKGRTLEQQEPIMDDLLGALQTLMMATAADAKDAKTHLKKPTPFHGDRKLVKKFIQECDCKGNQSCVIWWGWSGHRLAGDPKRKG